MVRQLEVYEVLGQFEKTKGKKEKIAYLKGHESWALKDVIRASLDDRITFHVPETAPPYVPNKPESVPSTLHKQHKMFTYFVVGGKGDHLTPLKRENIFIGMLEGIHPKDAEIMLKVIAKQPVATGMTKVFAKEVFPELFI